MFLSIPRKISHVFEGVHVLVKTDLVLGKAPEIQGAEKSDVPEKLSDAVFSAKSLDFDAASLSRHQGFKNSSLQAARTFVEGICYFPIVIQKKLLPLRWEHPPEKYAN